MALNFEWDEKKAKENLKNHQVSFHEAISIFSDPAAVTISDPDHSDSEHRFIAIGASAKSRALIVVYTERRGNARIISCRKATRRERRTYEKGNG